MLKLNKDYHRYLVITFFVLIMGTIFYQWVKEYRWIQQWRDSLQMQIEKITEDTTRTEGSDLPDKMSKIPMPPPAAMPPPPPSTVDKSGPDTARDEVAAKMELIGILKITLSETTSWQTIIKMIVTVLTTFFGIKLINHMFRRYQ